MDQWFVWIDQNVKDNGQWQVPYDYNSLPHLLGQESQRCTYQTDTKENTDLKCREFHVQR